ncbi:MAG TPA: hypothetical protein VK590_16060 [Saprospiraceae bacterium]|nr:hypothetical protein [Saprospiraceae bacterium]
MDKENFQLLSEHFLKEKNAMKARLELETANKLSKISNAYNQEDYNSKLQSSVEADLKILSPKLEQEIFADFGGSEKAAKELFEMNLEEQRKSVQSLYTENEVNKKEDQPIHDNGQTQKDKDLQKVREQFQQQNLNNSKSKGKSL